MDNIDEVEAYKNEKGNFDITVSLTQDGKPAKAVWKDMQLNIEMDCGGTVRLVFESPLHYKFLLF